MAPLDSSVACERYTTLEGCPVNDWRSCLAEHTFGGARRFPERHCVHQADLGVQGQVPSQGEGEGEAVSPAWPRSSTAAYSLDSSLLPRRKSLEIMLPVPMEAGACGQLKESESRMEFFGGTPVTERVSAWPNC